MHPNTDPAILAEKERRALYEAADALPRDPDERAAVLAGLDRADWKSAPIAPDTIEGAIEKLRAADEWCSHYEGAKAERVFSEPDQAPRQLLRRVIAGLGAGAPSAVANLRIAVGFFELAPAEYAFAAEHLKSALRWLMRPRLAG